MADQSLVQNAPIGTARVKTSTKRWVLAFGLILLATAGVASDRMILWGFLQTCIADHRLFDAAFPCLEVHIAAEDPTGYAVLRAPFEATHIVVTPTVPISGIESPGLIASDAPNYIKNAWDSRHYVEDHAGRHLAWDDIGLAVNSLPGRSQDQLHIHVDCVDSSVRRMLRDNESEFVPDTWVHMKQPIHNTRYWALLLKTDDLNSTNVFQLATTSLRITPEDQSNLSLAVIGAITAKGQHSFYLLADIDQAGRHRHAHTEYLLDHSCADDK